MPVVNPETDTFRIPYGVESGQRIVIDPYAGVVALYGADDSAVLLADARESHVTISAGTITLEADRLIINGKRVRKSRIRAMLRFLRNLFKRAH